MNKGRILENSEEENLTKDEIDLVETPSKPLPIVLDGTENPAIIPNSPIASISTGLIRSMIMYPLYFWFRAPIKLFRPTRIDYLDLARALVPPEQLKRRPGQVINFRATSIGLLSYAVNKKGMRFIPKYVVPPLFANSLIGITLFASYDQAFPFLKNHLNISESKAYFMAGGIAGFIQAIVATPFDSIKIRMEAQELLGGKHRSLASYYKRSLVKLGINGAYRGFLLNGIKDSLGFAVFFGLFENSKRFLISKYTGVRIPEQKRSWSEVIKEGSCVIGAGMLAGAGFQAVDYPLQRVRTILLVRAARMELNKPYFKTLYSSTYKQIKELAKVEGISSFFYQGFTSSLYKAVPSTALGFLCYEGLRQYFDGNINTSHF